MRFLGFISLTFGVLYLLALALLAGLNRPWWRLRPVRLAALSVPAVALALGVFWAAGARFGVGWLYSLGSGGMVALFVYLVALSLALLVGISLFYNFIAGYEEKLLEAKFGERYSIYKQKTGKWLPKI